MLMQYNKLWPNYSPTQIGCGGGNAIDFPFTDGRVELLNTIGVLRFPALDGPLLQSVRWEQENEWTDGGGAEYSPVLGK